MKTEENNVLAYTGMFCFVDLRDNYSSEVLAYATTSNLRKEHKNEAANLAVLSPAKVLSTSQCETSELFTPEEAVALFIVNGQQTKSQYQTMRLSAQWKSQVTV